MMTPGWRNWQTRRTQNPVGATPCGFDSRPRHFLHVWTPSRSAAGGTSPATTPPRSIAFRGLHGAVTLVVEHALVFLGRRVHIVPAHDQDMKRAGGIQVPRRGVVEEIAAAHRGDGVRAGGATEAA